MQGLGEGREIKEDFLEEETIKLGLEMQGNPLWGQSEILFENADKLPACV